jgi:hypothetical protein
MSRTNGPGPQAPAPLHGLVLSFPVLVILEDGFLRVATVHDVVDRSGILDARLPGHARVEPDGSTEVNIYYILIHPCSTTEPTEEDLRQVMAATGTLLGPQTAGQEKMVEREIGVYRSEQRHKR